jgi:hypothetical protein
MEKINSSLDKWISRIWSIMFALCIGVSLFVIAYATAA